MPFPVKNYRSTDTGLSHITATEGALVSLLEACLVTGFNLRTLDALAYDSQTDTFTGTCNAGHGYRVGQIVLVAGASPSEFNCELRVTAVTATGFTAVGHADDARPATATASGSMTVKAAPQGSWSKPYASADGFKAVFRMESPESSGCCLRVDNSIPCHTSYGMYALVDGYEQMGDLDVGTNHFGYLAERNNAWGLRSRTSYLDAPWVLVADEAAFWLNLKIAGTSNATHLDMQNPDSTQYWRSYFFGDCLKRSPGDGFACLLASSGNLLSSVTTSDPGSSLATNSALFNNTGTAYQGLALARNMTGDVGKKIPAGSLMPWNNIISGQGVLTYPSPVDNSLLVQPNGLHLLETVNAIRAQLPGLWTSPQKLADIIMPTTLLENFPGAEARQFMAMYAQNSTTTSATSTTYSSVSFVDLTGPWR